MHLLTIAVQLTAGVAVAIAAYLILPILWDSVRLTFDPEAERFEDVDGLADRDRKAGL